MKENIEGKSVEGYNRKHGDVVVQVADAYLLVVYSR